MRAGRKSRFDGISVHLRAHLTIPADLWAEPVLVIIMAYRIYLDGCNQITKAKALHCVHAAAVAPHSLTERGHTHTRRRAQPDSHTSARAHIHAHSSTYANTYTEISRR